MGRRAAPSTEAFAPRGKAVPAVAGCSGRLSTRKHTFGWSHRSRTRSSEPMSELRGAACRAPVAGAPQRVPPRRRTLPSPGYQPEVACLAFRTERLTLGVRSELMSSCFHVPLRSGTEVMCRAACRRGPCGSRRSRRRGAWFRGRQHDHVRLSNIVTNNRLEPHFNDLVRIGGEASCVRGWQVATQGKKRNNNAQADPFWSKRPPRSVDSIESKNGIARPSATRPIRGQS
jgi:hypothetical protein